MVGYTDTNFSQVAGIFIPVMYVSTQNSYRKKSVCLENMCSHIFHSTCRVKEGILLNANAWDPNSSGLPGHGISLYGGSLLGHEGWLLEKIQRKHEAM